FYFAAVGAFAKPQQDSSYAMHDITGTLIIPLIAILATVDALVARAPGRLVGLTILPVALVILQLLIVGVGRALGDGDDTTPVALGVLGLHALNGLAIMGVAGTVLARSRAFAFGGRMRAMRGGHGHPVGPGTTAGSSRSDAPVDA